MDYMSRACFPITVAMTVAILLTQSIMIASGCYCTIADRETIEGCTLSELLPSSIYLWSFVLSFNGYHTAYCAFLLSLVCWKRIVNLEGFFPIYLLPPHSKIPGRMIKWMVFCIWFTFLLMIGAIVWLYGFSARDLYITISELVSISINSLICWQMIAEDLDGVRMMGRTRAHHHEIVEEMNERISDTANVVVQRIKRCMKLGCYGIIMHNVIYFVYDVTATPLRNGGKGEVSAYQIPINILFAIAAVFYRITCAQFIFYSI